MNPFLLTTSPYKTVTVLLALMLPTGLALAHDATPLSLRGVKIPTTPGLLDGKTPIVIDKNVAVQLGKALFWDTNIGSDGMACASCHFHAGADARVNNQLSPGKLHRGKQSALTFQSTASGNKGGVNYTIKAQDFPFYQFKDPTDRNSKLVFLTDDVFSSAGVFFSTFNKASSNKAQDDCTIKTDSVYHLGDLNTRQSQNRHTPTVINSAFNFRNFWDGRANNIFNGVSPYGVRDTQAAIWVQQQNGTVRKEPLRLENASLASQAMAPPTSNAEMSCSHRKFPDIARKILKQRPLAYQDIHPQDSVLAKLKLPNGKGLVPTYEQLIKKAFAPRYWAGQGQFGEALGNAAAYTQMEANFSLFFGLALQLYEQTLISDQSPFDTARTTGNPNIPKGLNTQQARGLKIFLDAHCATCHKGPTLSAAANPSIYNVPGADSGLVLRRTMNGAFTNSGVVFGLMDEGFFNTSVTPTSHDLGVGGVDPFGHPLSFSRQYMQTLLTPKKTMTDPVVVKACNLDNPFAKDYQPNELIDDTQGKQGCASRSVYAKLPKISVLLKEMNKKEQGRALVGVNGAFKVPSLRNVELTGPYMHNGSMLTLEQVVDFYFRGGNANNPHHFATLVFPQGITTEEKADLVAFLKSLTDERVRWERAPFDHPQILIPHGHAAGANPNYPGTAKDNFLEIPAVGKNGRNATLGPLQPFDKALGL